jgi:hypothetical protein
MEKKLAKWTSYSKAKDREAQVAVGSIHGCLGEDVLVWTSSDGIRPQLARHLIRCNSGAEARCFRDLSKGIANGHQTHIRELTSSLVFGRPGSSYLMRFTTILGRYCAIELALASQLFRNSCRDVEQRTPHGPGAGHENSLHLPSSSGVSGLRAIQLMIA